MPKKNSRPDRPALLSVAIVLNIAMSLLYMLVPIVVIAGTSIGGVAVTLEEGLSEAFPVLMTMGAAGAVSIAIGAVAVGSIFLCYAAWKMNRFALWVLVIWSILHLSTGCGGLLTILTVIGCVQALGRIDPKS